MINDVNFLFIASELIELWMMNFSRKIRDSNRIESVRKFHKMQDYGEKKYEKLIQHSA